MNYINKLLFGKRISKEKSRNTNLTDSSIKRLARKAGILYLPKDTYSTIKNMYFNITNDTLKKVEKITKQRNGKIIKSKDLEFLILKEKYENLYDQVAGNYDGWCDSQPTQCQDSITLCGGNYKKNIDFLFPHKTFKRYLRINKNTDLKISSNLAINLHTFVENYVNNKLIEAKNLSHKTKDLKKSLLDVK